MWRVLIVEDDPQMRAFFVGSVSRAPTLHLESSAASVAEAKACLDRAAQGIDVLLTDLGLPDGSGLEVIRHARRVHPQCEALVISMFGDEDNVLASIEAGALGYIHKDAAPSDIAHTIVEMKAGASPISPMIARRVLSKYLDLQSKMPFPHVGRAQLAIETIANEGPREGLTRREQEVLELIARGYSYADIARQKFLSVHTIQSHVKSLYRKLAVHSRGAAVFEATRAGFLVHPHSDTVRR